MRDRSKLALSTNIVTAAIVGTFVGIVIIALVFVNLPSASPNTTSNCGGVESGAICLTSIQLYSGSKSEVTLSQNCTGDAQLVIHGTNLSTEMSNITKISIVSVGSPGEYATVLVAGSNSCLTLGDATPSIPSGFFSFYGYADEPITYLQTYNYSLTFGDGQVFGGELIAQS
jgi:hypothetical protein